MPPIAEPASPLRPKITLTPTSGSVSVSTPTIAMVRSRSSNAM